MKKIDIKNIKKNIYFWKFALKVSEIRYSVLCTVYDTRDLTRAFRTVDAGDHYELEVKESYEKKDPLLANVSKQFSDFKKNDKGSKQPDILMNDSIAVLVKHKGLKGKLIVAYDVSHSELPAVGALTLCNFSEMQELQTSKLPKQLPGGVKLDSSWLFVDFVAVGAEAPAKLGALLILQAYVIALKPVRGSPNSTAYKGVAAVPTTKSGKKLLVSLGWQTKQERTSEIAWIRVEDIDVKKYLQRAQLPHELFTETCWRPGLTTHSAIVKRC